MTGVAIKFNPPIPRLEGMTDKERCEALYRYMQETARQVNLMADNIEKRLKEMENNAH